MKAIQERIHDARRQRLERDLNDAVAALFERWPVLAGFAVQERSGLARNRDATELEGGLVLTDVGAVLHLSAAQAELLFADISGELVELLAESPEAAELLRGRTFARA